MEKKNDLCERLLRFAVDVILYLRTVKNTVETMERRKPQVQNSKFQEPRHTLQATLEFGAWSLEFETLKNESSELKHILASILNKLSILFFFSWVFGLGIWGLEFLSHKNLFT